MTDTSVKTVMDSRLMGAILAMTPGGISVIGVWTCLKTMASEDSEGCVRLYPGHKMDAADLADYLHCEPALVETALDVFGKLQWITVEDGVIRVPGFGKAGLSEMELAQRREYERLRKARWRAKRKQLLDECDEACHTDGHAVCHTGHTDGHTACHAGHTDGHTACHATSHTTMNLKNVDNFRDNGDTFYPDGDNFRDNWDSFCPDGDSRDTGDKLRSGRENGSQTRAVDRFPIPGDKIGDNGDREHNIYNIYNKYNNNNPHVSSALVSYGNGLYSNKLICSNVTEKENVTQSVTQEENVTQNKNVTQEENVTQNENGNGTGSDMCYMPGSNYKMVMLENLSEPCRNVLEAWNKLPLKKFTGLIPPLLLKLNNLLDRYGEGNVCYAIENIGRSPFLLGYKSDFHITLGWLLDPKNFSKVCSGMYQDRDADRYLYRDRQAEQDSSYPPEESDDLMDEDTNVENFYY